MSAEAPRNSGQGKPIHPQRPDGGFSGFFKRFIERPTPKVIQPPVGLRIFADRLRQGVADVTNELNTQREQTELERIEQKKQEAIKIAEVKEAERLQRQQLTESRLQALGEIKEMGAALKIRDRLTYINATVWEGKGQIKDIATPSESATERFLSDSRDNDLRGLEAGYELIYSYEVPIKERNNDPCGYSWRYTTGRESTSLRVYVGYADPDGTSINGRWSHVGKGGKFVNVSSEYLKSRYIKKETHPWYGPEYEAEWLPLIGLEPSNRDGVEKELEQLLISESTERIRASAIPSKLYLAGQDRLKEAKSSPHWRKWEYVQTYHPEGD